MTTEASLSELQQLYKKYHSQAIKDYETFLKFQSISSEPAYKDDVLACADWVRNYLKKIGFEVEFWKTSGYPTIFAKYDQAGSDQPTLLIYNHYDVQPVDPLELWKSPPFSPTIRDGQVYARGAQDNKGQCFYVLLALKALLETYKSLPINIKLCIEGEEECGSLGLAGILKHKAAELRSDYLAIVDLGIPKIDQPSITLGVRGIVTMDLEVLGTRSDLHSGSHGGIAYNPIHALTSLLASARDSSGKITIPGFYDDMVEMTDKEKSQISLEFNVEDYEDAFGAAPTGGEKAYRPLERNWMRPTLEINGINGGYSGDGFKTVIPAKAIAKISCRIVPNQDPEKVGKLVAEFFEKNAPEGVTVKVTVHKGGGRALHARLESAVTQAFAKAYQEVFQKPCKCVYSGASIPIVTELTAASKSEVILVGLGLASDAIHAPNEHFGLDRIEKGFLTIARAIQLLKSNSQS